MLNLRARQHRGAPGRAWRAAPWFGHRVLSRWGEARAAGDRPRRWSGRALRLRAAERLAHTGHELVELTGLRGGEQRVEECRQFVLGRDRDAGLALLELYGLRAVEDRG